MKKILYSVFMLATMVLAACSSDDTTEPAVKRGMVLKANVEDTDTRATITCLSPIEAMKWLEENMIPYYPLGVKKDKEAE